jgi:hypothetical protein
LFAISRSVRATNPFTCAIAESALVATMKVGFPWWIIVKLVCWLGLASISGMAYRKPQRIPLLTFVAIALILTAIVTVYFRHVASGSYE